MKKNTVQRSAPNPFLREKNDKIGDYAEVLLGKKKNKAISLRLKGIAIVHFGEASDKHMRELERLLVLDIVRRFLLSTRFSDRLKKKLDAILTAYVKELKSHGIPSKL